MGQVGNWVLYPFFFLFPKARAVSLVQQVFPRKRSLSLANYHLLGPPAVYPSYTLHLSLCPSPALSVSSPLFLYSFLFPHNVASSYGRIRPVRSYVT
jgi:hypothetical protein